MRSRPGSKEWGSLLRGIPAICLALASLTLPLALPDRPEALATLHIRLPLSELGLLLSGLLLLPAQGRTSRLLRLLLVALLLALVFLKLADLLLWSSLGRPFNLAHDFPLAHAGWMLLSGMLGTPAATLAVAGGALLAFLAGIVLWLATGALLRFGRHRRLAAGLILLAAVPIPAGSASGGFPNARLVAAHVDSARAAARDMAALADEAREDRALQIAPEEGLGFLHGTDVILAFVESYGRTTHENPLYRPTTLAALREMEAELAAAGYEMRSAWLTAPTVGGQSWLSHATLLSGLWIGSEGRYSAWLASSRASLIALAGEGGWRTLAVMPAITMPWPEGIRIGYDRIYAAADLGYRGQPFNWVTMPDQYVWSALERLEWNVPGRPPLFAEVALISSHAPWTPLPRLVPWEEVGDGRIFDSQAAAGPAPEALWRNHDRVRDHFRQTIDYALRTAGEFTLRHAARMPLVILLGDHQPAPMISGDPENRDVPVHLIGPRHLVDRLSGWNWTPGLVPGRQAPVWRMDAFRGRFLQAFSGREDAPVPGPS